METIDEKQAVRFLLGDLSEESRLKLEERFFKEDRFYEQLLAIQEELADDYSILNGEYEVALKGAAKGKLEAVGYYYFIALEKQ
ncbi:MAG: hypothetical protein LC776_03505 [Acidobacteria bacterium]|nr:hypothetical protein [Acidobacteriota bacterium]